VWYFVVVIVVILFLISMEKSTKRRNSKTDESQAQNPLNECPKLDDKFAKLKINSTLLETKEFSSIIKIIDHSNKIIKTELAKALNADDYDYFTVSYRI
jgi:hypothetical protein